VITVLGGHFSKAYLPAALPPFATVRSSCPKVNKMDTFKTKTHYEVLGIAKNATRKEVVERYQ
jgi:hypothetical protein